MNLYAVLDYMETGYIMGVFTTLELAQAAVEAVWREDDDDVIEWEQIGLGSWYYEPYGDGENSGYEITMVNLDEVHPG